MVINRVTSVMYLLLSITFQQHLYYLCAGLGPVSSTRVWPRHVQHNHLQMSAGSTAQPRGLSAGSTITGAQRQALAAAT